MRTVTQEQWARDGMNQQGECMIIVVLKLKESIKNTVELASCQIYS